MKRILLIMIFSLLPWSVVPASAFVLSYGESQTTGTGDQKLYIEQLLKEFQKDNPDAKVELWESKSYLKPIIETLMGEHATSPDVAIGHLNEWPILYRKKLLRPFAEVLSTAELARVQKSIRRELDVQVYGVGVDAKAYAIPFQRSTPVLYLNQKLLPDLKKTTITWQELEAALKKSGTRLCIATHEWIGELFMMGARGNTTLEGHRSRLNDANVQSALSELRTRIGSGAVYAVATQPAVFDEFTEGRAAAAIMSLSPYQSVLKRAAFSVRIAMPPLNKHKVTVVGGGDLILPRDRAKTLDEKNRRDLRAVIVWYYLGRGAALWSRTVGYFPVTTAALHSPTYQEFLSQRPQDSGVFRNLDNWKVESHHALADYCMIVQLKSRLGDVFKKVVSDDDLAMVLRQGQSYVEALLKTPCTEPLLR